VVINQTVAETFKCFSNISTAFDINLVLVKNLSSETAYDELADAALSFDTDKVLENKRKASYLSLGLGARVFYKGVTYYSWW
jgi:hypothetical protein